MNNRTFNIREMSELGRASIYDRLVDGDARLHLISRDIYQPGSHQALVHLDTNPSRLLLGSSGTGKTKLAAAEALFCSRHIRVNRGLYLTDNVIKVLVMIESLLLNLSEWKEEPYRDGDARHQRFAIQDHSGSPSIIEIIDWDTFAMSHLNSLELGWIVIENPPGWWGQPQHQRAIERLRRNVDYQNILYIIDFLKFYKFIWTSDACNTVHQFSGVYGYSGGSNQFRLLEINHNRWQGRQFIDTSSLKTPEREPASEEEVQELMTKIDNLLEGEAEIPEDVDAVPKSISSGN